MKNSKNFIKSLILISGFIVSGLVFGFNQIEKESQKKILANKLGEKVLICHFPPGNLGNSHPIEISVNALKGHLAHGDTVGPCQTDDDDGDDDTGVGTWFL
ncbi:hypothetical protein [Aurantibacter aestuarii]|uniref:Uncharacterized protein n=1 Tax=Aurantibacter aestuarii TaxID=1266046 RepID=A0A2T1NFX8_9FLAO|nr:hypothetical protein [Aurantibacter aestuarii]PSG91663.1 hypothetical protein C7H52_00690 [Aurantibacter aestuarii]